MCVPVPVESIQGVAGQRTILPCNIQPRESNDAVSMVLWFKEDSGEPLYSSELPPIAVSFDCGRTGGCQSGSDQVFSHHCGSDLIRLARLSNGRDSAITENVGRRNIEIVRPDDPP
ncbi:hypothetical protein ALC60_12902 [Trachymyrmex zeteki]|uniref:Ig-like domain-containing protein n=1 Tax=Mycetomoellerius zeteki TaxID=64791 RepID=A0A151WJ95_9HYME|nr:hypothetical protein ALC60_12902 [Trachymyrmex zeteki]